MTTAPSCVARLADVGLRYGKTVALAGIHLDLPAQRMVGLIGPDGVGKSSLLALLAGARALQQGSLQVLDGDMRSKQHRQAVCPRIAYMPQGLGKTCTPRSRSRKTCSSSPACSATVQPSGAGASITSRTAPACTPFWRARQANSRAA